MRDVLLQPGACNLVGALSFLGDALAHLDQHALPWLIATRLTFASWTLKVACSRWWTGVAALLLRGGNVALLPVAWRTDPLGRSTLVSTLGSRCAAQMINPHVLGYYTPAVALAFEGRVDVDLLLAVADARVCDGATCAGLRTEDMMVAHWPRPQLN